MSCLRLYLIVSFMYAPTPPPLMVSRLRNSVLNPGMATYSINNGLSFNHVSLRVMISSVWLVTVSRNSLKVETID